MWKEVLIAIGDGLSIISSILGMIYYFVIEKKEKAANINSVFMKIIFTSFFVFHCFHMARNLSYSLVNGKAFKYYMIIEYTAHLALNLSAQLIYCSFLGLELPVWINLLRTVTFTRHSNFRNEIAEFISKRGRMMIFSLMGISVLIAIISVFLLPRLVMSDILVMAGTLYINFPLTIICMIPITVHMLTIIIQSFLYAGTDAAANATIRKKIRIEAMKIFFTNVLVIFYGLLWILIYGSDVSRRKFEDISPEAYDQGTTFDVGERIGFVTLLLSWVGLIAGLIFLTSGEASKRIKTSFISIKNTETKPKIAASSMATQDFLSTRA